ncbi:MAG: NAD-dependent epimerase/dehydratase [Verrucomicrobiales bacterium]|nr:NAD-dependent epimerase/dehydratase [Verrucomicrobiales bacterium]
MRVLIVGCGYVGLPLGTELVRQGHEVFGLRRSAEGSETLVAAGIKPLTGDITQPSDLQSLPGPFEWVVNTVSSTKGGAEEYKEVYLQGTRNLVDWLAGSSIQKYVYTSSTSVYGQTDNSQVKESSSTEPKSQTSQVLVETERFLLDAFQARRFPTIILRAAGIYGPDRGHLFLQYLKNEARIAGKGERIINMIHRDDLVGMIIAALKNGRAGEVYNAVDDEPVTQIHFFRWLSETLGKHMPPFATEEENSQRKRGLTNKKVSNRKVKMELGYAFQYPTFRQGYTAEIQRLDQAGQLNTEPEPR